MQSGIAVGGHSALSHQGGIAMRPDELDFLIDLLKKRSGLALTHDKAYLLESRLTPIARAQGCADLSALVQKLKFNPPQELLTEITEAMTTNESSFFRDSKPFDDFKNIVIPQVMAQAGARRKIRLWSAACSTGQEAYTLGITWLEDIAPKNPGWQLEMVGSDLAQKVVDKAKQGQYSQFEVQRGMPIKLLMKYFKPQPDTTWMVGDQVKTLVQFKLQNLLESYASLGKFDVVFCRNVLIYFDEPTKAKVIDQICNSMEPKGYLYLGSTEVIMESNKARLDLVPECRGVYRLK